METSDHNSNKVYSSIFDRITHSVVLKIGVIFFLTLLMLIPMSLIDDLVKERSNRNIEVSKEIESKWGKAQVLSSLVLAVPYTSEKKVRNLDGNLSKEEVESWIFLLSTKDKIDVKVKSEVLKRGIYSSVVYTSDVMIRGDFSGFDFSKLNMDEARINWQDARLLLGVEDLKGITRNPILKLGDKTLAFQKDANTFKLFPNVLEARLNLKSAADANFTYNLNLGIRGSESVSVFPLANESDIEISGNWANASFKGGYLPETRELKDSSFSAVWLVNSYARKVPQEWMDLNSNLYDFGRENQDEKNRLITQNEDKVQVSFLSEINDYQKTTRAVKYGVLIIILTFVSLFFTEIIKKERIHFIQYILIGAAMVMFYSLLLAFSEHIGFNWAYLIASISTVILIATFVKSITKNNSTGLLFSGILSVFYTFIFILMQLRDFSLLVGSVGVFLILAILMRLTTKINWYQFEK